jgi:hypothetical protein
VTKHAGRRAHEDAIAIIPKQLLCMYHARIQALVDMVRTLRRRRCLEALQKTFVHMPPPLQLQLTTMSVVVTVPAQHRLLPPPPAASARRRASMAAGASSSCSNEFVCLLARYDEWPVLSTNVHGTCA